MCHCSANAIMLECYATSLLGMSNVVSPSLKSILPHLNMIIVSIVAKNSVINNSSKLLRFAMFKWLSGIISINAIRGL
jgi:hypothetical protein